MTVSGKRARCGVAACVSKTRQTMALPLVSKRRLDSVLGAGLIVARFGVGLILVIACNLSDGSGRRPCTEFTVPPALPVADRAEVRSNTCFRHRRARRECIRAQSPRASASEPHPARIVSGASNRSPATRRSAGQRNRTARNFLATSRHLSSISSRPCTSPSADLSPSSFSSRRAKKVRRE
jgi:hypothetical protein